MFAKPPVADVSALERVEALVRRRYGLPDDALVLVTEEEGPGGGAPPRMTTILFWTARDERHRLRLFRPAAELGEDDLPPRWLRGALRDAGESDCC